MKICILSDLIVAPSSYKGAANFKTEIKKIVLQTNFLKKNP